MGSAIFSNILGAEVDSALHGRWTVLEIQDEKTGKLGRASAKEPDMAIEFGAGYASLYAGGKRIGGEISATGGAYHVVRYMTTTSTPCDDALKSQACRLYRAFSNDGNYLVVEKQLHLFSKDGQPTLVLALIE